LNFEPKGPAAFVKPKLVIVFGPTAAGKSELVLELAPRLNADVINADSQQVYRQMDIGTAKPSKAARAKVPHYVIDVVDPDEEFNVARYRELATAAAHDIRSRGKQAIVSGGTGLYIKALTRGLFMGPAQDARIRSALNVEAETNGLSALYQRLERVDSSATSWIHPHDRQRIIRALEVYELTGRPISEWQKEHAFRESAFSTLKIGLDRQRVELYDRINQRCDQMIEAGLVHEVKGLFDKGYSSHLNSLRSVGYRHMGLFLMGRMRLDEAVHLMKRDTRRLAKRQLTWFRRDEEIHWFHPERQRQEIQRVVESFIG
jgi:tRNA dimethylallyltransferase